MRKSNYGTDRPSEELFYKKYTWNTSWGELISFIYAAALIIAELISVC